MKEAIDMDLELDIKRGTHCFDDDETSDGSTRSREDEDEDNANATANANSTANNSTAVWKSAIDPSSGKIYYYDKITRKTQWNKVRCEKYAHHSMYARDCNAMQCILMQTGVWTDYGCGYGTV